MLQAVEAAAAVLFLALLLRIALLLGGSPVRPMLQELLYLRGDTIRPLVRVIALFLVLEGVQFLLPTLRDLGYAPATPVALASRAVDAVQAVLLVAVAAGTLWALAPYSRRSLEDLEAVARRGVGSVAARVRAASPSRTRPPRGA